jgi:putative endonuclease
MEGRLDLGVRQPPILTVRYASMNQAGREAEDKCAAYLERAGLEIVARNWRCRLGELDLVAREGETLVFVEVRYRRSERYGGAAGSIVARKRARLLAAAKLFLSGAGDRSCRFDAMLVRSLAPLEIEWLRDAISDGGA